MDTGPQIVHLAKGARNLIATAGIQEAKRQRCGNDGVFEEYEGWSTGRFEYLEIGGGARVKNWTVEVWSLEKHRTGIRDRWKDLRAAAKGDWNSCIKVLTQVGGEDTRADTNEGGCAETSC